MEAEMTLTLELPNDVEAGLLAAAQANGLSPEAYAAQVLRERLQVVQDPQPSPASRRPPGRKSLVELFEPLRGLDLDFSRNESTGRPVDL